MMEFEYMINEPTKVKMTTIDYIIQVLDGIQLTKAEVKTLEWIAGWEPETIENLIEIFVKCRTEGR